MSRAKPMGSFKEGLGWQHCLEGGPYDGLVVRAVGADPTITFFDGRLVYERQLWLDDDGRPVMVVGKRAKKDGGDFEAAGYRYVWRDTGVAVTRHVTLKVESELVYGKTVLYQGGGRQVTEFIHPQMGVMDEQA